MIMNNIFINFTNHPSATWNEKQKYEAEKYGKIIDLPFPIVSAKADEREIVRLAEHYTKMIAEMEPAVVLCQGEFCLAYQVIFQLKEKGIIVLAACSERKVKEFDNKKEVIFDFEQFRKY